MDAPKPKKLKLIWRKFVCISAKLIPIESPGWCMFFTILIIALIFMILPDGLFVLSRVPAIADALTTSHQLYVTFEVINFTVYTLLIVTAWQFQARCIQLCYPKEFNPHNTD